MLVITHVAGATIRPEIHRKAVTSIVSAAQTIKMPSHSNKLDRLRIATPCPMEWDQMAGDNRVRFCSHCQLNVYNISELSRNEAEALIASTEGRICARLYRRADATILTRDCPVGLEALKRKVSKLAGAVFATMLSLCSTALGQTPSSQSKLPLCTPQTRITRKVTPKHEPSNVSGTILDPMGAVIPSAKITITNIDTDEVRNVLSDDAGRFQSGPLPEGTYSIKIEATPFTSHLVTNVVVEGNQLTYMDATLQIAGDVAWIGLLGDPGVIDTSRPGTTIFSGDRIRKLPFD